MGNRGKFKSRAVSRSGACANYLHVLLRSGDAQIPWILRRNRAKWGRQLLPPWVIMSNAGHGHQPIEEYRKDVSFTLILNAASIILSAKSPDAVRLVPPLLPRFP